MDTEAEDQGPYNASQVQSIGNYVPGLLSDPDSNLTAGDR